MRGRTRLLGIVVTILCLGLAFYGVDFRALLNALATANYALLPAAVLLWVIGYMARTLRWRTILAGASVGSLFDLFGVLMAGFATNNLLPARLGELARAYLLRRRTGLRKTFVLASIFLERVFDGLALVALILLLSMLVTPPEWDREVDIAANVRLIELVATVTFVGVAVAVAVLLFRHELATQIFASVAQALPTRLNRFATGAFAAFVHGLSSMKSPGVVAGTSVLSVVVWTIEWSAYFTVASAFHLGLAPVQLAAACAFLLVVVNLGIMLPAAPGYVGTFQFFAVSALAVWGVPREQALAVAIVAHLTQYVLVTGIGLVFFGREHLSLRAMAVASREPEPADGDEEVAVSEARS
jgi:glycosyltransferase 2 family protein